MSKRWINVSYENPIWYGEWRIFGHDYLIGYWVFTHDNLEGRIQEAESLEDAIEQIRDRDDEDQLPLPSVGMLYDYIMCASEDDWFESERHAVLILGAPDAPEIRAKFRDLDVAAISDYWKVINVG